MKFKNRKLKFSTELELVALATAFKLNLIDEDEMMELATLVIGSQFINDCLKK